LADPTKATAAEAQCADERFTVVVELGARRGTYRLKLKPTDTTQPAQATVRFTVMIDGHPQVAVIPVGVR